MAGLAARGGGNMVFGAARLFDAVMTCGTRARYAHVIKRARRHGPCLIVCVMASIAGGGRNNMRLGATRCVYAIVARPAFFRRPDKDVVVVTIVAAKHRVRADQRKASGKVIESFAVGENVLCQRERRNEK